MTVLRLVFVTETVSYICNRRRTISKQNPEPSFAEPPTHKVKRCGTICDTRSSKNSEREKTENEYVDIIGVEC